jgi:hypothetical protein
MPETPAMPDCRKCWHFGIAIMPEKGAWQNGVTMLRSVKEKT